MAKKSRRQERAKRAQQPDLNKNALKAAVGFAGLGAALAFYSTTITFGIESQGLVEASGCSFNDWINCDVANASSYAKMFSVPVAWFGFLFYAFAGLSALFAATSQNRRSSAPFIAFSLVLAFGAILFTFLKAYHLYELGVICIVCIGMYIANFGTAVTLGIGIGYGPGRWVSFVKDYIAAVKGDDSFLKFGPQIAKIATMFAVLFGIGYMGALSHSRSITGGVDVGAAVSAHFLRPVFDVQTDPGASIWGNPDAELTIVEFADFQCPACAQSAFHLRPTLFQYEDDVKVVFMNYPLDSNINPNMPQQLHPQAGNAAKAGVCAEEFGDFWGYHDEMFKNQALLGPQLFTRAAQDLGWDQREFAQCMVRPDVHDRVVADLEKGRTAQVGSTPTLYINGRMVREWRNTDVIRGIVAEELSRQ